MDHFIIAAIILIPFKFNYKVKINWLKVFLLSSLLALVIVSIFLHLLLEIIIQVLSSSFDGLGQGGFNLTKKFILSNDLI